MLHVKMKETRKGAAGLCRAGHVIAADADGAKAETLLAYVEAGVAEKLTEAQAKKALAASAETSLRKPALTSPSSIEPWLETNRRSAPGANAKTFRASRSPSAENKKLPRESLPSAMTRLPAASTATSARLHGISAVE